MHDTLILGGGPAGLACAMELHKAGRKVTILEKDSTIGGLSKTLEFYEDGLLFRTDIGPHRFFSKNRYLYDFIENLLDEKWILVPRQTRQLIEGKFYDYPINAMQAFKNIGFFRSVGMFFSYLIALAQFSMYKKILSFEDYVVANFGRKLAEFNMINYTEKIWGIPASTIHPDWALQRIKGLNLVSALTHLISKKNEPKSLVDAFYYPQYGAGLTYETIGKKIKDGGSEIYTESFPTKILHDGHRITNITFLQNNLECSAQPKHIVSSIPITHFVDLLEPRAPDDVRNAISSLSWRSQVYLFITLDKDSISKDNWIYFPDSEIPFGRISEMKNFSADMSPKGKTSLLVEFFVTEGDEIWNLTTEEVFELAVPHFVRLGLFTRAEVRRFYSFKKSHVYPVYDLEYTTHLAIIKKYLDLFTNLYYIGRPGRFRYNNQDHSLEMGIVAAKSILSGKYYDFDDIGMEQEYFEKGTLKKGT